MKRPHLSDTDYMSSVVITFETCRDTGLTITTLLTISSSYKLVPSDNGKVSKEGQSHQANFPCLGYPSKGANTLLDA